ncbi:unnamed protein product [Pleuronectes platessa]|uniref:Uncharacterized protein n=1 Tax=Pleuronectes platessa TaxID=8262 RepID=A0A9N7YPI4_PLEPL|nr:unnamed protein product [Pleuronectes platessa]
MSVSRGEEDEREPRGGRRGEEDEREPRGGRRGEEDERERRRMDVLTNPEGTSKGNGLVRNTPCGLVTEADITSRVLKNVGPPCPPYPPPAIYLFIPRYIKPFQTPQCHDPLLIAPGASSRRPPCVAVQEEPRPCSAVTSIKPAGPPVACNPVSLRARRKKKSTAQTVKVSHREYKLISAFSSVAQRLPDVFVEVRGARWRNQEENVGIELPVRPHRSVLKYRPAGGPPVIVFPRCPDRTMLKDVSDSWRTESSRIIGSLSSGSHPSLHTFV